MIKKTIAVVLLTYSGLSIAQHQEQTIDDIELYGKILSLPYKKVNENTLVIQRKDIVNSPAQSIDELLQMYSGIDIRRRGANGLQSDISVRGGSFEQTLILVNGIRMNDSQTGHNSMNIPVDLANVERIEVIKGPAARRFGNGAYSVINIVTRVYPEKSIKFSAEGGDFSTYNFGINANFGNEKFGQNIQANSGASEGYRYNTDYKINNVYYQNQLRLNDGVLKFQAGFSEKKFGANGFYASPAAKEQYEEVQASVVSISHQQKLGALRLNSNVYWRRGQDMYLFNRVKPEIYRNMHIGNNIGGEVNAAIDSKLGTSGAGIEVRKEFLASNNLGHRERFVSQLFLEHHFSFFDNKFQFVPGVTVSNISGVGTFFYPGADLGYQINQHHKIYGNVAQVHRIPTFTDLFYISKTEEGNPNLKPEGALSYELGYRFNKKNLSINASLFARNTNDAIDWVKETATAKWFAENVGNIFTKGVDVEIQQNFTGFVRSYSLGYTFLENKLQQKNNFSRYIAENLKHQFVAKLENKIFNHLTNQLIYRYQERITGYSYHLLDEKLTFRKNNLETFVLINNITNTQYTEAFGVPMPGRWFHIGVNYTLK